MSRVMIIGYGPLPETGMAYVTGACLRTRQILKPVLEAGHTVNLFTLPMIGAPGAESDVPAMLPASHEGLTYQQFTSNEEDFAIRMLSEQARRLEPAAIVAVGTFPAYVAARLGVPTPLWVDFTGHWMAENQGLAWVHQDDQRLAEAWAIQRTILRRLDKFSSATRAQLHATLGELGAIGRMNQYTFDYPFGSYMPNAFFRWAAPAGSGEAAAGEPVLRGPVVPPDAFILLWSGSFRTAFDVPMLVSVVNKLMEKYPQVHFVATGGRVERVITRPYELLSELVEQSPYASRYHLLGWVPSDELPAIQREADLAINVDASNYETMFGGRYRLNNLAAEGVPIATTLGSEMSEWLDDAHAVMAAPMGDADALVEAIEPWIEQREGLQGYARRARALMESDFSPAATTRKLLMWLRNPKPAPDNRVKLQQAKGQPIDPASVALNPLEEQAMLISKFSSDELAAAAARLDSERQRRGLFFGFRRS